MGADAHGDSIRMDAYVAVQLALGVLLGLALFVVARLVGRGASGPRFVAARRMFALWWTGLGAAWLVWAADTVLFQQGLAGEPWAALDWLLVVVYFLLVIMAFGSLFYYLLVLYTDRPRLAWSVWAIYGAATVALLVLLTLANPPWDEHVEGLFATTLFGPYATLANALRALLLVPPILASLGLFALYRRLEPSLQRYRLLLVSTSLAFYLLMPLVFGSNPGVQPVDATGWTREVLNKVGLLVAIVAALLAYHPPAWVRRRYARPGEAS